MPDLAREHAVRVAAMAFLHQQTVANGGVVSFGDVADFQFEDVRVPLLDRQRGSRKPKGFRAALSIRTVYAARPDKRPYADEADPDGLLRYKWRGSDPQHAENRALRAACNKQLP